MEYISHIAAVYVDPGPVKYYPPSDPLTSQEILEIVFSPGMIAFCVIAVALIVGAGMLDTLFRERRIRRTDIQFITSVVREIENVLNTHPELRNDDTTFIEGDVHKKFSLGRIYNQSKDYHFPMQPPGTTGEYGWSPSTDSKIVVNGTPQNYTVEISSHISYTYSSLDKKVTMENMDYQQVQLSLEAAAELAETWNAFHKPKK